MHACIVVYIGKRSTQTLLIGASLSEPNTCQAAPQQSCLNFRKCPRVLIHWIASILLCTCNDLAKRTRVCGAHTHTHTLLLTTHDCSYRKLNCVSLYGRVIHPPSFASQVMHVDHAWIVRALCNYSYELP